MSVETIQFDNYVERRDSPTERRAAAAISSLMLDGPGLSDASAVHDLDILDQRIGETDRRAANVGQIPVQVTFELAPNKDTLAEEAAHAMDHASKVFLEAVANYPIQEPAPEDRHTEVTIAPAEAFESVSGWKPNQTFNYASYDPFQALNPEVVEATTGLISTTITQAEALRLTHDPELAYLTASRSKGNKKPTLLTKKITDTDAGICDWISHLPDAERLRIVAKPWRSEGTIVVGEDGQIVEIPQTPPLQALVGAAGDGRAVREREAWERHAMAEAIDEVSLAGDNLVITSLGTGTGEPAMDTAIDVMGTKHGGDCAITVNGFDVNPRSLAVAQHIAGQKLLEGTLQFNPRMANLLSREGIEEAVGGTDAHVYEAIGFAEYVPSDGAPTEMEQAQRKIMARGGCLSAQEFYGTIYANMPEGSVLLTGNMRNDSPQASFVVDGLGWKGIIQRSTADYLRILEEADIPGEAVKLYMPDPDNSAAVYNLVAITKQ